MKNVQSGQNMQARGIEDARCWRVCWSPIRVGPPRGIGGICIQREAAGKCSPLHKTVTLVAGLVASLIEPIAVLHGSPPASATTIALTW